MNWNEAAGILAILKVAYPSYYKGMAQEEMKRAVHLWHRQFQDVDADTVTVAVDDFIRTDTKGFPPVIGQIHAKIRLANTPQELGELEAWALVQKALKDSAYGAEEQFERLPMIVQKTIGRADLLKEWGQLPSAEVGTVIQSHFVRNYRARVKLDEEVAQLSDAGRQRYAQVNERRRNELTGGSNDDHVHE